jgi:hypothetical protein
VGFVLNDPHRTLGHGAELLCLLDQQLTGAGTARETPRRTPAR